MPLTECVVDDRVETERNHPDLPDVPPFPFPSDVAAPSQNDIVPICPLPTDAENNVQLISDFAGMDVPCYAMAGLCLLGSHIAFEIDKTARAFIRDNFTAVDLRGSVRDRGVIPDCDHEVVVAGFPCQPFSRLGKQEGWSDSRGRGDLLQCTIDMIMSRLPFLVLLENVAAFVKTDNGRILKWVVSVLEVEYAVHHTTLCSSDFGLPQSRRRWFLLAIRKDRQGSPFSWPQPLAALPLVALLGPASDTSSPCNRPGRPGSLAARNVERRFHVPSNPELLHSDIAIYVLCRVM